MDKPSPVHIRVARITAGIVLVIAGILMLVLPGPGILTIVAGFAVLAKDFPWAQRIVDWMHDQWDDAKAYVGKRREEHTENASEKPQTDAA
ncbi:MAG: PGPGW domain-containing protein [Acidimicrobiia bacterium]